MGLGGGVAGAAAVVGLHLAVDLELDRLGVADVGEAGLALLAGRLEQQVADADEALEQGLGEGDVVDPLQRISRPNLATTPERKISRSVVSTKWVVAQRRTRPATVTRSTASPRRPTARRAGCCRSPAGMTTQAAPTATTTATVSSTGTTRVSQCGRRS